MAAAIIYPLPLDAAAIAKIIQSGGALVVSHGHGSVAAYPLQSGYAPETKTTRAPAVTGGFKPINIAAAADRLAASGILSLGGVKSELDAITKEINRVLALDFSQELPESIRVHPKYTGAAMAEAMENVLSGKWSDVKLAGLAMAWRFFVLGNANADFMSDPPPPGGMTEIEARGYLIKEHFGAVSAMLANVLFLETGELQTMHQVRSVVAEYFAFEKKKFHLLTDAHVRSACEMVTKKMVNQTFPEDSPVFNVVFETQKDLFLVYRIPRYTQENGRMKPVFSHIVDHMLRQIIEFDPLVLASVPPPSDGEWPLLTLPLSPSGELDQGRLMFPSINESTAFQEFNRLASAALREYLEERHPENKRTPHVFTGVVHVSDAEHRLADPDVKIQGTWVTAIVNLFDSQIGCDLNGTRIFLNPGRIAVFERQPSVPAIVRPSGKKQVYLVVNMIVPSDSAESQKNKQIKSMLLHSGLQSFGTDEKQQIYHPDFSVIIRDRRALPDFILHLALLQRKDIVSKFHTTLLVRWTSSSVSVEAYPGFTDQDRIAEEGATFAQVQKTLSLKTSPKLPPFLSNAPGAGFTVIRIYPADMPSIQNYLGLITDSPRIMPKASVISK